ncbi:NAD(P)/FAD-dependent oxidoreductase [Luteibacter sp. UNCMF366Tsu5.1]|uniref:NAD(P)/FAD-dependent oxidoreductase n=1 Tax=Luteibacter sp. UNCMF366Tsu5.1 TaxID=1502758 RepID=UPI0009086DA2|nr:tryptophan 7-halogenase [Luteibacter sp. UNCMF366Tsu5.1]SFW71589.1 Dehydrogenase (flavoprotein) [Luteibacter sp. UNCMF366Tsu5.1]
MDRTPHDAVILGGGLAGLTLAMQLKGSYPDMDIVVLERQVHPLPEAAHKVGESTVEIAAHYFADTLGLRAHLDEAHIRKFGFRFFFSEGKDDLADVAELGVSAVLPTPSYQIDRGILENFLGEEARRRGIDFREGVTVRGFDIGSGEAPHSVRFATRDGDGELQARWLLDASGRAGLMRRKLDLTRDNGHHANAVWFRIDDRIAIDDWCDDPEWKDRCHPAERWRSTNHLCGPGYWVWLIPLSSGAHSVGIVADAAMHPLERMKTFDLALAWLEEHQPMVARHVASRRDKLMDFAFFRHFSYGCARMFSSDRWALTGEAGAFLDPFYSPGSDFIAIANTYITLLVGIDRRGENLASHARHYERLFFSFYEGTLRMYRDQYNLFGDPEVLPIKVIWDYAYYWGVLCQLVFQDRLGDAAFITRMGSELVAAADLNTAMQGFFQRWHAMSERRNRKTMMDQRELTWFADMNATLHDKLDDEALAARLRNNVGMMRSLAATIVERAAEDHPTVREDYDELANGGTARMKLFA